MFLGGATAGTPSVSDSGSLVASGRAGVERSFGRDVGASGGADRRTVPSPRDGADPSSAGIMPRDSRLRRKRSRSTPFDRRCRRAVGVDPVSGNNDDNGESGRVGSGRTRWPNWPGAVAEPAVVAVRSPGVADSGVAGAAPAAGATGEADVGADGSVVDGSIMPRDSSSRRSASTFESTGLGGFAGAGWAVVGARRTDGADEVGSARVVHGTGAGSGSSTPPSNVHTPSGGRSERVADTSGVTVGRDEPAVAMMRPKPSVDRPTAPMALDRCTRADVAKRGRERAAIRGPNPAVS